MTLRGKTVAVLAEDNYQELELWYPLLRLREAGAEVRVVGSGDKDTFTSGKGYPVRADVAAADVSAADFDAVIVPGGFAPDKMRRVQAMTDLVRDMHEADKVVAAICHAAWVLVSADILRGRRATCVSAIKDDVINAGAEYVDEEVVVDANIITSRTPPDLPAFCREIIRALE